MGCQTSPTRGLMVPLYRVLWSPRAPRVMFSAEVMAYCSLQIAAVVLITDLESRR